MNFNPRPPRGGRLYLWPLCLPVWAFQSTPPARGATPSSQFGYSSATFQSTPPARGATFVSREKTISHENFNPRPPRGGRHGAYCGPTATAYFNPRPPRGGRRYRLYDGSGYQYISIHAPREGGDGRGVFCQYQKSAFQSTPPARGATPVYFLKILLFIDFNPRPPRGGRRAYLGSETT